MDTSAVAIITIDEKLKGVPQNISSKNPLDAAFKAQTLSLQIFWLTKNRSLLSLSGVSGLFRCGVLMEAKAGPDQKLCEEIKVVPASCQEVETIGTLFDVCSEK